MDSIRKVEHRFTKGPWFANGLRIAHAPGVSRYDLCFGEKGGESAVPPHLADRARRVEAIEANLAIRARRTC